MIIQRDLIHKIRPFLERKEFLSITGPRQAGKSTFLRIIRSHLIDDLDKSPDSIQTVTFEDRKLLMQFERDPVAFVDSFRPAGLNGTLYLMIDEFQYASDGGQKLKLIYDTVKNMKVIITGSSSLDIKANVGRFMVGRIMNFHLFPFNFGECLRARNYRLKNIYTEQNKRVLKWLFSGKEPDTPGGKDVFHEEFIGEFERYCIWGGYPEVVLSDVRQVREKILAEIYNSYVLKDIKSLMELATEKNLFLLSQYLATQIGNVTVYQNLGRTAGLNHRQLKKHLSILEETFVCREVRPFFRNRQKELCKNPKIFFIDLGFRNSLVENFNGLDKRPESGAIVENAVFIRLGQLFEGGSRINFWRTKAGAEVDFILHAGDKVIPVEVKYSSFATNKISRSMMSFISAFKPRRGIVLTRDYWGMMEKNGTHILFLPAYYL